MRPYPARAPIGLAFFVFLTTALATFAAIPSPEKLLPDDTLEVLTAPDFSRLRATWEKQPITPEIDVYLANLDLRIKALRHKLRWMVSSGVRETLNYNGI